MQELVPGISGADPTAAGLLIECRARSDKALDVSRLFTSYLLLRISCCLKYRSSTKYNCVICEMHRC